MGKGKTAYIRVHGTILSERRPFFGGVTPDLLRIPLEVTAKKKFHGVIFEINSPGGEVVPSREIALMIKAQRLPSVAYVRGAAVSGAYLVAAACDLIVADEMSLVGSVGVLGSYVEVSGLMEKLGVSYERLVGGNLKDIRTPLRKPTEEEREVLQNLVDEIHEGILDFVAVNRRLTPEQREAIADGRFFLGKDAKALGLVDVLGGRKEAEAQLNRLAGLTKSKVLEYRPRLPFLERILGAGESMAYRVGQGAAEGVLDLLLRGGYRFR